MDISDAIEEISPERRETLVAAWQNMKPETSMKTVSSKCNMASAMAAVDFRKSRSKFERSLKDIRKQTSLGKKDERERRVAAFLVSLPPQAGLDDFLKVVDFPAATRALGKTFSEKWFKEYIRIIVKSVLEKTKPIDHIEDDDDDYDQESSDDHEENDSDGHDRSIIVASFSSSNNVVGLIDGDDEKIAMYLIKEDDDGDNPPKASAGLSPKTGEKRKENDGSDEVKSGATAAIHKRLRLADEEPVPLANASLSSTSLNQQEIRRLTHTSSNEDKIEAVLHQLSDQAADRGLVSKDNGRKKKNVTFVQEDTIYYFPSPDKEQAADHSVFAADQSSSLDSLEPVEDDEVHA